MLTIRRGTERGHAQHGWLDSWHTFSFADYHDPAHMAFGNLRVLNEDRIAPGAGFPTHGHRDMEIVTYVLSGALAHADSLGNGTTIRPGDVQRMSAGRGVSHSEFNAAPGAVTHLLQIWLLPQRNGLAPGYEQKAFAQDERRGRLRLVASRDGRDGSLTVHADAAMYAGLFTGGERAELVVPARRRAWVQVARGALDVNGTRLAAGDAAGIAAGAAAEPLVLSGGDDAEVLVFDLRG
jgi:hypothetical protein